MEASTDVPLRLLSLDGGGVRGLSSLMILKDIMRGLNRGKSGQDVQQPWEVFDLIGGTSTGGLLAVMLGRLRMTVEECEAAYLDLSERIFNPRRSSANFFGRGKDLWKAEGRFDAEELKACIIELLEKRKVGIDTLLKDEESRCKVSYENEEMSELLYDSCKIWEACRATSAATTFFAPIEIGPYAQRFADGAIAYNNPIQLVYREAETLWPSRIREAILISIGTGSAPAPALEGNVLNIVKVLKDIVVQTESTADDFFSDHLHMTNKDLLYRFNVYHGLAEIGLEEYKEKRRIADATHAYLTAGETRQRWRKCIQKLGYESKAEISTPIANMSSPRTPVAAGLPPLPHRQVTRSTIPRDSATQWRLDNQLLGFISKGDEARIRRALDQGANIQTENNKSLMLAITRGAENIVQLLLDEGAKIDATDDTDKTPVWLAVEKENCMITTMLAQYGANLDKPMPFGGGMPLHRASQNGNKNLVKVLLQNGANQEAQTLYNLRTPLHMAAWDGQAETVTILLDAGCNIEALDSDQSTPLHYACYADEPGDFQCVKLLIEQGANIEARDNIGEIALHCAAWKDKNKLIELLVEKGADIDARNNDGETALEVAIQFSNHEAIRALRAASLRD